jgi:hypothetical protein
MSTAASSRLLHRIAQQIPGRQVGSCGGCCWRWLNKMCGVTSAHRHFECINKLLRLRQPPALQAWLVPCSHKPCQGAQRHSATTRAMAGRLALTRLPSLMVRLTVETCVGGVLTRCRFREAGLLAMMLALVPAESQCCNTYPLGRYCHAHRDLLCSRRQRHLEHRAQSQGARGLHPGKTCIVMQNMPCNACDTSVYIAQLASSSSRSC